MKEEALQRALATCQALGEQNRRLRDCVHRALPHVGDELAEQIRQLLALSPGESPIRQSTVKVRIPVVVDTQGNWNAAGWRIGKAQKDVDLLDAAYTGMDDCPEPWQVAWITAEVPAPKVPPVLEVEGAVEVEVEK